MHEIGIAVEILHGALKATEEREGSAPVRLLRVRVAVGELSSMDPAALKHAWQSVVSGSLHEHAELEVVWCPVYRMCPSCNAVKEELDCATPNLCPDCHGPLAVEGGRELDLETVEFERIESKQPQ